MKPILAIVIFAIILGVIAIKLQDNTADAAVECGNVGLVHIKRPLTLAQLGGGSLTSGDIWLQSFTSVDLSGINNDGFKPVIDFPAPFTRSYEFFDEKRQEAVLAEVHGAGIVTRIRFARAQGLASNDHDLGSDDYDIRIYIDDPVAPIVSCTMAELVSGKVAGFSFPLVAGEKEAAGGLFVNTPMPFRRYFRIAATGIPHFHAISVLRLCEPNDLLAFKRQQENSEVLNILKAAGQTKKQVQSGSHTKSVTVDVAANDQQTAFVLKRHATVTSLTIEPENQGWTPLLLQKCFLEIRYDNEVTPRVSCPLGIFFGSGLHDGKISSIAFGRQEEGSGYCNFPMPFDKNFRLSIRNESKEPASFSVQVVFVPQLPARPFGYFSAHYAETKNPVVDQDVTVLKISGRGRIVGMAEDLLTRDPMVQEGNTRIFIDGVRTPAHQSDGHETWWGWAWYRGPLDKPYQLPTQGYTYKEKVGKEFRGSFYRNMLTDFIPFERNISISFEHGPVNTTLAEYRTVVFFYHRDETSLILTDEIDVGQTANEQVHHYRVSPQVASRKRQAVFEGVEAEIFESRGYDVGDESQFRVKIAEKNNGVRLVRLSNPTKMETQQRANIFVDGELVGEWFQGHYNPAKTRFFDNRLQPQYPRWLEDQFSIPQRFTRGKQSIAIRIVSLGLWNEFNYRIYSFLKRS